MSTGALIGGSAGILAAAGAFAYAVRGRSSANVFGPSVYHGDRERPALALTFDDGPSESTPELLKILARHRIPATFFMCGRKRSKGCPRWLSRWRRRVMKSAIIPIRTRDSISARPNLSIAKWPRRRKRFSATLIGRRVCFAPPPECAGSDCEARSRGWICWASCGA